MLGGETAAYGLCRPPGHHAARAMYGGYCFFNNAAIAAHAITRATGERVAILDVDFHHGNGTQQIFWRRGDVRYVSIHADPDRQYPYFLGRADETGEGDGAGENLNIPLRAGATNDDYLEATDRAVEAIAAAPGSIVVVSLGFDTYGLDPIGDFALTTDVYHEVGRRVAALGRRLVILQEGGYHRPSLGENARAWLRGAEGREFDPTCPRAGFSEGGSAVPRRTRAGWAGDPNRDCRTLDRVARDPLSTIGGGASSGRTEPLYRQTLIGIVFGLVIAIVVALAFQSMAPPIVRRGSRPMWLARIGRSLLADPGTPDITLPPSAPTASAVAATSARDRFTDARRRDDGRRRTRDRPGADPTPAIPAGTTPKAVPTPTAGPTAKPPGAPDPPAPTRTPSPTATRTPAPVATATRSTAPPTATPSADGAHARPTPDPRRRRHRSLRRRRHQPRNPRRGAGSST